MHSQVLALADIARLRLLQSSCVEGDSLQDGAARGLGFCVLRSNLPTEGQRLHGNGGPWLH